MTESNPDLFKSLSKDEEKRCTNTYQSDRTKMLKMLRNSRTLKIKNGWPRDGGAGFTAVEIQSIWLFDEDNKTLGIRLPTGTLFWKTGDFNLRETEAAIEYLELKICQEEMKRIKNQ